MSRVFTIILLLVTACASVTRSETESSVKTFDDPKINFSDLRSRPYVILISIDGYRHDYTKMFLPPTISELARNGVSGELIPIYPSKTFPNHYAIITGRFADENGIVSNSFMDPTSRETYAVSDKSAVHNANWYFGEPLWATIEKKGLRTASLFWVASEAPIGGRHPNYYLIYNESTPNDSRVDQIANWLRLPEDVRPHFLTLYFSDVDTAGHRFGPDSSEVKEAVMRVDHSIGYLNQKLKELPFEVQIIIVSDHGMAKIDPTKTVVIDGEDKIADLLSHFVVFGNGPQMQLYLKPNEDPRLIQSLSNKLKALKSAHVLTKHEREELHYKSPRAGDLIVSADFPYSLILKKEGPLRSQGNHGWAPSTSEMHGLFIAQGSKFKSGFQIGSVENVNIYPLVLEVLGLPQNPDINGSLRNIESVIR